MFVKSQDGSKYINLDRVDVIEINPLNNAICKINGNGHLLGSYQSLTEAQESVDDILDKHCLIVEG